MHQQEVGYMTIEVDANGNAAQATVSRGGYVSWQLVDTATQNYSIDPPANIFVQNPDCATLSPGGSIGPYQVKNNAGLGNHTYDINAGSCEDRPKGPGTGAQMITIDP
jgi:hypothetical protein